MAIITSTISDRVKDTSITTGTGTLTLANSPPAGYQSFNAGVGDAHRTTFLTTNQPYGGTGWELARGTYTNASTTLTRESVIASSNGGALVSWGAGTKDVIVSASAQESFQGYFFNRLTSDLTFINVATQVLTAPTSLAGESWKFRYTLFVNCSSTNGVRFSLNGPGTSTLVIGSQFGPTSGITAYTTGVTGDGANGPIFVTFSGTNVPIILEGVVIGAGVAGASIQVLGISQLAGNTVTVKAGSFVETYRISG